MFPDDKKITATGILVTGFLMAGIVGQIISGYIIEYLSWNYVFYIMGIIYFINIFLVLVFLPQDNITRLKTSILQAIKKMGLLFEIRSLVLCYAVDIMFLMSMMCMYTALGYYLSSPHFGLSTHQILYVRAAGLFGIVFAATSGLMVKRFGIFSVLVGGLLIAAFSLISLAFISNLILLVIMSVVFVAGIAVTAPALISIIAQIGGQARGSALSLHTVILFVGAGLGPIFATSLLSTGIYTLPFLIMGGILFIGVGLALLIKNSVNNHQKPYDV